MKHNKMEFTASFFFDFDFLNNDFFYSIIYGLLFHLKFYIPIINRGFKVVTVVPNL